MQTVKQSRGMEIKGMKSRASFVKMSQCIHELLVFWGNTAQSLSIIYVKR
jgi:hypothetical protein